MAAPLQDGKAKVDDDDDVDDLDDVLDQFDPTPKPKPTATTTKSPIPRPTKSKSSAPAPPNPPPPSSTFPNASIPSYLANDHGKDDDLDSDFARELQKGMESLMREMGGMVSGAGDVDRSGSGSAATPSVSRETAIGREQEEVFKKAWEAMLVEEMDGLVGDEFKPGSSSSSSAPPNLPKDGKKGKQDFQAGIKAAMEKLKSSESGFKDSATPRGSSSSDPLENLLLQLSAAGLGNHGEGEEGGENEEELQGMLELMMNSLMSKEVLYEPLKELGDKFPEYVNTHSDTLSPEDKTRYENQMDRIKKILAVFESPGYSDDDKEKSAEVVELMSEMQSFGSPPTEIMGDLPPGLNIGPDGMPALPEGCVIS